MITRLLEMARKRSCDKSRDVMDPINSERDGFGDRSRLIQRMNHFLSFIYFIMSLYLICAIKIQKMGLLP